MLTTLAPFCQMSVAEGTLDAAPAGVADGALNPRVGAHHGRVVVIGEQPLLEANFSTNPQALGLRDSWNHLSH